jgi:hypothetical protein
MRFMARQKDRTPLNYPVAIQPEGGKEAILCHMMDVSVGGATLLLDAECDVPDEITLLLSAMGARRKCHVVWRRAGEIGIKFQTPATIPYGRGEKGCPGAA